MDGQHGNSQIIQNWILGENVIILSKGGKQSPTSWGPNGVSGRASICMAVAVTFQKSAALLLSGHAILLVKSANLMTICNYNSRASRH